jgi:hypothetical protein
MAEPPSADDSEAPALSWPAIYAIVIGALAVQVVAYYALSRVLG